VLTGRLAALDAALWLGHIGEAERDRRARPIRAALDRERALRPFLDRLFRPSRAVMVPAEDEMIACRCEEVSVGQIRRAARLGAAGPNQLKAFTRCGMGPCQGGSAPGGRRYRADVLGKPMPRSAPIGRAPLQTDHRRRARRSRDRRTRPEQGARGDDGPPQNSLPNREITGENYIEPTIEPDYPQKTLFIKGLTQMDGNRRVPGRELAGETKTVCDVLHSHPKTP